MNRCELPAIDRTRRHLVYMRTSLGNTDTQTCTSRGTFQRRTQRWGGGEIINSDHKHIHRSLGSGTECATVHIVRTLRNQSVVVEAGTAGILHAVAVAAVAVVVAEVEKCRTVGSGRRLEEVEVEAHHYSILETAVVGVRTVAEIHTPQVEKAEADMTIVSSGEVGIQVSAGTCFVVVVVVAVLGVDTGYAEAEVAGENISFAAAENTRSAEEVVGWKPRAGSWSYCPASLARHRDHGWVSVEVEVAERIVAKVAVGVEPVKMIPPRIGLAFAQDLTSCTDFERVEVEVEAETSL